MVDGRVAARVAPARGVEVVGVGLRSRATARVEARLHGRQPEHPDVARQQAAQGVIEPSIVEPPGELDVRDLAARVHSGIGATGGAHVKADAEIGPFAVLGRGVVVEDGARLHNTIVWPNTRIGQNAVIDGPILGRNCHLGRNVSIVGPSVIGDKTTLTDYTHL